MRCGLIGCVTVINVIVGRHIGQLTIMLRFCMCAGIGTRTEIVRVVDYDAPRIVLFVCVLVADKRSVNSHDTSLSPADLRRRNYLKMGIKRGPVNTSLFMTKCQRPLIL